MSSTLTLSKNLLAVSLSAEEKGGISGWLSESGNWSVFRLHFNSHLLHLVSGKKTLLFPQTPLCSCRQAEYRELQWLLVLIWSGR